MRWRRHAKDERMPRWPSRPDSRDACLQTLHRSLDRCRRRGRPCARSRRGTGDDPSIGFPISGFVTRNYGARESEVCTGKRFTGGLETRRAMKCRGRCTHDAATALFRLQFSTPPVRFPPLMGKLAAPEADWTYPEFVSG